MSDNHSDIASYNLCSKTPKIKLANKLLKLLGVCLAHCVGQCLWGSAGPVVVRDMGLVQQALCLTTTLSDTCFVWRIALVSTMSDNHSLTPASQKSVQNPVKNESNLSTNSEISLLDAGPSVNHCAIHIEKEISG